MLERYVRESLAMGCAGLSHLDTPLGKESYRRKAGSVAARLTPGSSILDWGCGYGQMSFFLRNRGFRVIAYSVENPEPDPWNRMLRGVGFPVVYSREPVALPFGSGSFDSVLACGVLEHVQDEEGSLRELGRVLRPGGLLFVFMHPNRFSYTEFLARWLFRMDFHERCHTLGTLKEKLWEAGFEPVSVRYSQMFPRNFSILPRRLRRVITGSPAFHLAADDFLSRIPLLRRLSGTLEGVFIKREERG